MQRTTGQLPVPRGLEKPGSVSVPFLGESREEGVCETRQIENVGKTRRHSYTEIFELAIGRVYFFPQL